MLPISFIDHWKIAVAKSFINSSSSLPRRIPHDQYIGDWKDQEIDSKWLWWISLSGICLYKRNDANWLVYTRSFHNRYLYTHPEASYTSNIVFPMSIKVNTNSIGVEIQVPSFSILQPTANLSDFKDSAEWGSLVRGLMPLLLILLYYWTTNTYFHTFILCLLMVSLKILLALWTMDLSILILLLVLLKLLPLSWPLPLTMVPNFTPRTKTR